MRMKWIEPTRSNAAPFNSAQKSAVPVQVICTNWDRSAFLMI